MKNYSIIFLMVMSVFSLSAQTADIIQGCLPLEVKFTGPTLSAWYWDFKDGTFSTEQNPTHIFTQSGTFEVVLKEGASGLEKAKITIRVYEVPTLNIEADPKDGCSPLKVNFSAKITAADSIKINAVQWTFGDGGSSTGFSPTHIYSKGGTYNVSYQVITSLTGCNTTKIFEDLISVFAPKAAFSISPLSQCEKPYRYGILNQTAPLAGNIYQWYLPDGSNSSTYNIGNLTFNTEGEKNISLVVTDAKGCKDSLSQTINAGKPRFDFSIKRDSVCLNERIVITNNNKSDSIQWTFVSPASIDSSSSLEPIWFYNTPGFKTVKVSSGSQNDCKSDTSFVIYVAPKPDAKFDFNPEIDCKNPMIINLVANDLSHAQYFWQNSNKEGKPIDKYVVLGPKRDSLYMNYVDTIFLQLTVKTKLGCTASTFDTAFHQKPDAYFFSTKPSGCVPLEVTFTDQTFTHVPLKSVRWLMGDGTVIDQTNTFEVTHTFTKPGLYYVKSVIENINGCRDTSASTLVRVGDYIKPTITIDKSEICLGETANIAFTNTEANIDYFHISTDDYRYNHCWKSPQSSHQFMTEPGTFDIIAAVDYNGCITEDTMSQKITVKGAKANISYMIDCTKPLEVMLISKSLGQDSLRWTIGDTTYVADSVIHKLDKSGDYPVILTAKNVSSGCPANIASDTIHIRQVEAIFELPTKVCDNRYETLDALLSKDVDTDCSKGYLWKFSYQRPIEDENYKLDSIYIPVGNQWIQLIVEDINGCRDTLTKNTRSYGITPSLSANDTDICFPANVMITNNSISDTTIVKWDWSTGQKSKNLNTTLRNYRDDFYILVTMEDRLGCMDTASVFFTTYKPVSEIFVDPQNTICLGNPVTFFATDFTEKGSSLNFSWRLGDQKTSDLQTFAHTYLKSGNYRVRCIGQEKSSGCLDTSFVDIKVINPPVADFTTSVDGQSVICHPKIIDFTNTSKVEGDISYVWDFGKSSSLSVNPSEAFGKGSHEVKLYVVSPYGCADTISKTYTLIGPEAGILKDKNKICTNEKIQVSMINAVDVSQWSWQFGDGVIINNQNQVIKSFDPNLDVTKIPIELIVKSDQSGCTLIIRDSILFDQVKADFSILDTSFCQGLLTFENKSVGADKYFWTFENDKTSTSESPSYLYNDEGQKTIRLIVSDISGKCMDTLTLNIELSPFKDVITFPNVFTPNGDNENDLFYPYVPPPYEELIEVVTLKVFNRWGQLITDDTNGWNGNHDGKEAPAEVYAYYMEVRLKDCRTYSKKGNVKLIR